MKRRAKIVATIGPSSSTQERIEALIWAGMNVARLNFSHGTQEEHAKVFQMIRQTSEKIGKPVAILQDLPGPKIRCGRVKDGVVLHEGQRYTIQIGDQEGDESRVFTQFESLHRDVRPGERILLDDGKLVLQAEEIEGTAVHCCVLQGGELFSKKGINLPESRLSIPAFTEQDRRHLAFGLQLGVDFVALSFVRDTRDLLQLKKAMAASGKSAPIIAKIEKPEAIKNLDAILEEADGIMVARGDLAVEMSSEEVPILQKHMIEAANRRGKIVITATQMLESMRERTTPTRAEASDVANAVFDGTDALMLSAESASGKYPIESVSMMARIIETAEKSSSHRGVAPPDLIHDPKPFRNMIAKASVLMAQTLHVPAIVVFSYTGTTARLISDYRPNVPIIAFTPSPAICRRMVLYWGVSPFVWEGEFGNLEELMPRADKFLCDFHLAEPEQPIVVASENTIRLHRVGTPYYDDSNRSYDNLIAAPINPFDVHGS